MRRLLQLISSIALAATLAAPILFLIGRITLDQSKWLLLATTIVWFAVTPFWMGRPAVDEELVI